MWLYSNCIEFNVKKNWILQWTQRWSAQRTHWVIASRWWSTSKSSSTPWCWTRASTWARTSTLTRISIWASIFMRYMNPKTRKLLLDILSEVICNVKSDQRFTARRFCACLGLSGLCNLYAIFSTPSANDLRTCFNCLVFVMFALKPFCSSLDGFLLATVSLLLTDCVLCWDIFYPKQKQILQRITNSPSEIW